MFDPTVIDADILQRIRDYCPELASLTDSQIWIIFVNIWNELMAFMCWSDMECNSLLLSNRTLIKDINIDCYCRNQVIFMHHSPVTQIISADITFISDEGIETVPISNPESFWMPETNEWNLFLTSEVLSRCPKKCDIAKLKLVYEAGYEEIPDCFYTVFCHLIVQAICDNNCLEQNCYTKDKLALNAVLKRKTVGALTWEYDVPNNIIVDSIAKLRKSGMWSIISNFNNCVNKIDFEGTVGAFC